MIINKPTGNYALAVIGSGPAGLSVAKTLADSGQGNILLIESGRSVYDKKQNELGLIDAKGDLSASYFRQHNIRMFGGTSAVWAGFCAVLEKRAFQLGEWPISYEDLHPYYAKAGGILELPKEAWQKPSLPIEGTNDLIYKPFYLSRPVRFGKKYREYIENSQQIHLLEASTVTKISTDGGHVSSLLVADDTGNLQSVKAKAYVLASGGIANARLLKLSGIGNEQAVGRFFMEHPHIYNYGKMFLNKTIINTSRQTQGVRVNALQLSDDLCVKLGLLSFSVSLHARNDRGFPDINEAGSRVNAIVRSEMAGDADNAISLSDKTDWLKQANPMVDFHFKYQDSFKKAWLKFGEVLLRNGLGRVGSYHEDYEITGGGHMIGSTRMGVKPENSCVDGNCQVHNLSNLYVAGSSVFPAGGAANPTFTIVALAIRLGEHLARVLKA